jgi:hypothetical protein
MIKKGCYWVTLLIIIAVGFQGCYYDSEEDLYPVEEIGDVTYELDIAPIIQTSCAIAGCHVTGGTGAGVFEDYAGVKAKVDQGTFRSRVLDRRDMPPGFALGGADLQKIEQWLNEGAPNN